MAEREAEMGTLQTISAFPSKFTVQDSRNSNSRIRKANHYPVKFSHAIFTLSQQS
jgi:hypothetical protein